jgi:hypothetical protein
VFADSGENSAGDGRRDRRGGRLADAARIGGAGNDMDLDLGHLSQPDHVVIGKMCCTTRPSQLRSVTQSFP